MDKQDQENRFRIDCDCTMCSIVFDYEPEECMPYENTIYISYHIDKFYAKQGSILKSLLERFKIAWKVLKNGSYFLYESGVKPYQVEDFRQFVNRVADKAKQKACKSENT